MNAQTVNGLPIKDIDVEYVQIVGFERLLSNKVRVQIDFGQENKLFSAADTEIRDANGRLTAFNSMIDALNFMHANGYSFVNAYAVTIESQNVYHYILKRNH